MASAAGGAAAAVAEELVRPPLKNLDAFLTRVKIDPNQVFSDSEADLLAVVFHEQQAAAIVALDQQLTLPVHSIGVMEVLLGVDESTAGDWIERTRLFFKLCDPAIVPKVKRRYSLLAYRLALQCMKQNMAIKAAAPLKTAITMLQTCAPQHITSLHGIFCQVCLLARLNTVAEPVLNIDCFQIEVSGSPEHDTRNILLYFHYGGMIYTGLKNYKRALEFFAAAVQVPGETMSAISMAAYKKYVLLALIVWGYMPPTTSRGSAATSAWSQHQSPNARIYRILADRFPKMSPKDFEHYVGEHVAVFNDDGNLGLVKQCLTRLYRHRIKRLTETFITLSLADIAKRVELAAPADAEQHIVAMVADKEIFASINSVTGMVSFHDDPEQYDDEETLLKLLSHLETARQIYDKITETDLSLRTDVTYIRKSMMNEHSAANDDAVDMDIEMIMP
eukprot:m.14480 g.14480  ORF g.14480 m.14480 type:complete len:448 (-) comp7141_c0_seq1:500-1843(-)